jgi:hypothetical protein
MPTVRHTHASRWSSLAIGLVALAGILTIYPPSLGFDFYTEDFLSLRPWSSGVLWRTFTGTWQAFPDAPGFYRPVSTLYYAVAFDLFGLNIAPLHILPLIVVTLSGWLVGLVVWRETSSRTGGMVAALLYCVHPGTTTAVGPWVANQYHGFATICALLALLYWQRCRTRRLTSWAPLLIPLVLAGFTKEDALMLPLVLVVSHGVIAWWTGTLAPPSRAVIAAGIALFAAMNTWRIVMLGGFGGYWWPEPVELLLNLVRGPYYILLVQLGAPVWAVTATVASVGCLVAMAIGVWRSPSAPSTRVALIGMVLLTLTNMPLMLMTSMARGYLLSLGAVFIVTAGLMTVGRWMSDSGRPRLAVLATAAVVVTFVGTSRERLMIYAPCSEDAVAGYAWIRDWMLPTIAPEFGPWLTTHITTCDPATYQPVVTLPVATWHLPGGDIVVLVTDTARAFTLDVSSPSASPETPVTLNLVVNGASLTPIQLTSPTWTTVPLSPATSFRTSLRRSHRVDVLTHGVSDVELRTVVVPH